MYDVVRSRILFAWVIPIGFLFKNATSLAAAVITVAIEWFKRDCVYPLRFFGLEKRVGDCGQRRKSARGLIYLNM
jgi:hypothetical protein